MRLLIDSTLLRDLLPIFEEIKQVNHTGPRYHISDAYAHFFVQVYHYFTTQTISDEEARSYFSTPYGMYKYIKLKHLLGSVLYVLLSESQSHLWGYSVDEFVEYLIEVNGPSITVEEFLKEVIRP